MVRLDVWKNGTSADNRGEGNLVQITGTQRSKKGVKCVAYVFVFLSSIIICWLYKWTLSDRAQVTRQLRVSLSCTV